MRWWVSSTETYHTGTGLVFPGGNGCHVGIEVAVYVRVFEELPDGGGGEAEETGLGALFLDLQVFHHDDSVHVK